MRKEIKKAFALLLAASIGMSSTVPAMGADFSQVTAAEAEQATIPDSVSEEAVATGAVSEEAADENAVEGTVTEDAGVSASEETAAENAGKIVSEETATEDAGENISEDTASEDAGEIISEDATTEEADANASEDAVTEDAGANASEDAVTEETAGANTGADTEETGNSDAMLSESGNKVVEDGQNTVTPADLEADSKKSVRTETSYVDDLGNTITIITEETADEEIVGSSQSAVTSRAALVKAVRANLVARKTYFSVPYKMSGVTDSYLKSVYNEAICEHTGNPQEGDYLHWNVGGALLYNYLNSKVFTVYQSYYTTASQESIVSAKVNQILSGLSLSGKSEYEKILAIHDYICRNVSYDYANLSNSDYSLQYTAYAALCHKKTVCQGYATLFYRMALQSGLDCRVITGYANGGNHGWNIVRIGNRYYNIDVTWDDCLSSKTYFLKTDASISDHVRSEDYASASFYSSYPMASTNYSPATRISLSGASVRTKSASYTYTGYVRQPLPVVTLGGKTLVKDRDYKVSYANNKNVGKATVTVTGTGSYQGTAKGTFNIVRCSIAKASVKTKSSSYVYTGYVRRPQPVVKLGNKTLKLGTDYKLSYANNKNVGTATVTVTGIGSYTGTAKTTFKLTKRSIANASVATKSTKYTVTGKARCPQPVVKLGKRTLVYGKEYTLSYRNNVKAGTATVIVTGRGNYAGTAKTTFKLVK